MQPSSSYRCFYLKRKILNVFPIKGKVKYFYCVSSTAARDEKGIIGRDDIDSWQEGERQGGWGEYEECKIRP